MTTATTESLLTTLQQIEAKLAKPASSEETFTLYDGEASLALLYAYLYLHFEKEEYGNRAIEWMEKSLETMAEVAPNSSLCTGFTGIGWLIQHFVNIGFLGEEESEKLADIDQDVLEELQLEIAEGNWDMLHGFLGKGIYFLERLPEPAAIEGLQQMVDFFEHTAIASDQGITWNTSFSWNKQEVHPNSVNLGMAHGIPSVIAFLSNVYRAGLLQAQVEPLLREGCRWLLAQEQHDARSLFPSNTSSKDSSRLAWCYGDLGITLAIAQAAFALQDTSLKDTALRIALHAARRDQATVALQYHPTLGTPEAGICHGTAGLAHFFHQLHRVTPHPELLEAANYWLNVALQSYTEEAQESGYFIRRWNMETRQSRWEENRGLLNGSAGVGLVLLAFIGDLSPQWSRLFFADLDRWS